MMEDGGEHDDQENDVMAYYDLANKKAKKIDEAAVAASKYSKFDFLWFTMI